MRRPSALFALLAAGCLPRGPSDHDLYIEAIAGGLPKTESIGRCDRITDPELRGDCLVTLIESRPLADPRICETLYPGSAWRDECFFTLAGMKDLREADRLGFCGQSGRALSLCHRHLVSDALLSVHRAGSPLEAMAGEAEAAVARLRPPGAGEDFDAAAWEIFWVRWQLEQPVVGLAHCAALSPALAEACEAGSVAAVEGLMWRSAEEAPGRARALCEGEGPLRGFRPVDGAPKLSDEPEVAAAARRYVAGWCAGEALGAQPGEVVFEALEGAETHAPRGPR